MTAQEDLKAALDHVVGPWLRANGYKGSRPNWRSTSELGDVAIVNVQSSMFSSSSELRCIVNLAVAPEPWLSLERFRLGRALQKAPESVGLYRHRLKASSTLSDPNGWWVIRSPRDAELVARDIVDQLDATGLPKLNHLLVRSNFVHAIDEGDLGFIRRERFGLYFEIADLVLRIDEKTHADRVAALALLHSSHPDRDFDQLSIWVGARPEE